MAESTIETVDDTIFPKAQSGSFRRALLHSRHGTRWQIWDFLIGFISFFLSFQMSPYFQPKSELGGQVSFFLGRILGVDSGTLLNQPQW